MNSGAQHLNGITVATPSRSLIRSLQPYLEKGDKIIMPPSALDCLASLHIDYPMLFELSNSSAERTTHCGVLEFIADEGIIYLSYWIMLLREGDTVQLRNASLGKGTYVKLQPHTTDFLDISNPKAVLETSLRNYSCLTTGDTIMVAYNNKKYYINIVETKPSCAISIIETDCEVDFASPLDYKEPTKPAPTSRLNKRPPEDQEEPAEKMPKFSPFTGSARRLDGKPSTPPAVPAANPVLKQHQTKVESDVNECKLSGSSSRMRPGKLVFGSNVNNHQNETPEVSQNQGSEEPSRKVEEPKFQAFTGKEHSLKG